ncbi:MAG: acetamidase/formamidase family protein [Acidimicrobiales bacterium]
MTRASVFIGRDQHVWSFAAAGPPAVTVDPGTVVEIETWDCFTGQVTSEEDTVTTLDLTRVNSATGPLGVRGAEPGDTLSVTLMDIRPDTVGAAMCIPGWGQLIEHVASPTTRLFQVRDGVVTMNDRVSFAAAPMLGVIGVAPESGDVSTFLAGRHGGNLDDHMNAIGATVHLPVFQSGAQLAIGDMHASMGDGEITGTGVEIGGTTTIKVDLIKNKCSRWPITETADAFYTHGTSLDSIDDALRFACEEAWRLLVDEWSFSKEDAYIFLSVVGDLGVAAYYHPSPGCASARMRVPKLPSNPSPFRI